MKQFFFPAELFAIGDFWNHFAYCHHSHCGLRPIKVWPPSVFLWSDHGCIMSLSNYIVHVEENINMLKFFCIYIIYMTLYEALAAKFVNNFLFLLLLSINSKISASVAFMELSCYCPT